MWFVDCLALPLHTLKLDVQKILHDSDVDVRSILDNEDKLRCDLDIE